MQHKDPFHVTPVNSKANLGESSPYPAYDPSSPSLKPSHHSTPSKASTLDNSQLGNSQPKKITRRSFLSQSCGFLAGISLLPANDLFSNSRGKVNFYNWDTYIGETTLSDFNKASGIKVKMDLFADNEELFTRFKKGNPGYDLIVPSDTFVERMAKAGLLEKIDKSKIPNFNNIDPLFLNPQYDPNRSYSVPYMWGTIGIGYRKSVVKKLTGKSTLDSYKWILDSDVFKNRIALISEPSSMLRIVLKYLGYDKNTTNLNEIKKAEELLIKRKDNFKVFAEDNGQDLLLSEEVDLAVEWNGDIVQVMAEDDDIGYAVPVDGSFIWEDALCIPQGAPNRDNVYKFINYLLDAKVGKSIAEFIGYATPNRKARLLTEKSYQNDPAIFPPDAVVKQLGYTRYLGEKINRAYEAAWTRVIAS